MYMFAGLLCIGDWLVVDVWLCCLDGGLHYWCLGRFCFSFCVLLVGCASVAVVC